MANYNPIDMDLLRQTYYYCPTGHLRKVVPQSGRKVEYLLPNDYVYSYLGDKFIPTHRLIYALHNGDPGNFDVDHEDQDKRNNKIANLRKATRGENNQNISAAQSNNATGVRGVSQDKKQGTWAAELKVGAVRYRQRGFKTQQEAIDHRDMLVRLHHPNAPTA